MKNQLLSKTGRFFKKLWKDESGQGTAEYILILAVVVGIITIFGGRIKEAVTSKLGEVTGKMSDVGN